MGKLFYPTLDWVCDYLCMQCMMTSSNETFSESLALCVGNSPVTGEFPSQRPVMMCFDIFFNDKIWLMFVPLGPVENKPAVVLVMTWHQQAISHVHYLKQWWSYLQMHTVYVCITWPWWVNIHQVNLGFKAPTISETLAHGLQIQFPIFAFYHRLHKANGFAIPTNHA